MHRTHDLTCYNYVVQVQDSVCVLLYIRPSVQTPSDSRTSKVFFQVPLTRFYRRATIISFASGGKRASFNYGNTVLRWKRCALPSLHVLSLCLCVRSDIFSMADKKGAPWRIKNAGRKQIGPSKQKFRRYFPIVLSMMDLLKESFSLCAKDFGRNVWP